MISKLICELGGTCILSRGGAAELIVHVLKRKPTEQEDSSKIPCIKCGKEYTLKELAEIGYIPQ